METAKDWVSRQRRLFREAVKEKLDTEQNAPGLEPGDVVASRKRKYSSLNT